VWDANSGQHLLTLNGPVVGRSVMFAPDAKTIMSVCQPSPDGTTVCIWDAGTGQMIRQLELELSVYSFWDEKLEGSMSSQRLNEMVDLAKFSWDGKHIITGLRSGEVRVWDADMGEGMGKGTRVLGIHDNTIQSASFSQDGRFVLSGSSDDTVCVWDSNNNG